MARGGEHHGRPGGKAIGGGEDGRTVGAQAEKGGVPQGDLAGEADEEVEPQNDDDVEADEVEDAQVVGVAHDQGGERQEQGQTPHHEPRVVADDKEFGFLPPTHGQAFTDLIAGNAKTGQCCGRKSAPPPG